MERSRDHAHVVALRLGTLPSSDPAVVLSNRLDGGHHEHGNRRIRVRW